MSPAKRKGKERVSGRGASPLSRMMGVTEEKSVAARALLFPKSLLESRKKVRRLEEKRIGGRTLATMRGENPLVLDKRESSMWKRGG